MITICLQNRSDNENAIEVVVFKDDVEEKFYFATKEELYNFLKSRG